MTWRHYLSGRGETDAFVVVIKRRVESPDESVAEDPERVIETTSDKGRQANRVSSHLGPFVTVHPCSSAQQQQQ